MFQNLFILNEFGFVWFTSYQPFPCYLMPNSVILINSRKVNLGLVCTRVKNGDIVLVDTKFKNGNIGLVVIRVKKRDICLVCTRYKKGDISTVNRWLHFGEGLSS